MTTTAALDTTTTEDLHTTLIDAFYSDDPDTYAAVLGELLDRSNREMSDLQAPVGDPRWTRYYEPA